RPASSTLPPYTTLFRSDHGVARVLQLAGEQVGQLVDGDHGTGRRQLAVGDEVLAVRRGVAAVRVLRHRDVAGEGAVLGGAAVNHRDAVHHDVLLVLDGLLDGVDVEHHHPVALVAHGAAQVQGALGVVAGGGGEATGVVGVAVVQVAVDDDLEGHLHGFGVHRAEAGEAVVRGEVHAGTVVRVRNEELTVGEHVLGVRHLLQTQTVDGLDVRDGGDPVRLHDVQTDTGDAGVGLVVDEQVLAVVAAVGHRDVRVVAVTVGVLG